MTNYYALITPTDASIHNGIPDYDTICGHVGGIITAVVNDLPGEETVVGYIHDEGHLLGLPINPIATALFGVVIAGTAVVVSGRDEDGHYDGKSYALTPYMMELIMWHQSGMALRPTPVGSA